MALNVGTCVEEKKGGMVDIPGEKASTLNQSKVREEGKSVAGVRQVFVMDDPRGTIQTT